MAKDQGVNLMAQRRKASNGKAAGSTKVAPTKAVASTVAAEAAAPKKRTSPTQFWNEVRAEGRKITWTSWKETWITSVMVGIMVVITAVFFSVVDGALSFLIQQLLKLASG